MLDTVVESASMRNEMSRKATMEYVGAKRRSYSGLQNKKAKSAAIDDFCQVTGADRKYAIRLLTGSRRYREHKGRGKTARVPRPVPPEYRLDRARNPATLHVIEQPPRLRSPSVSSI